MSIRRNSCSSSDCSIVGLCRSAACVRAGERTHLDATSDRGHGARVEAGLVGHREGEVGERRLQLRRHRDVLR